MIVSVSRVIALLTDFSVVQPGDSCLVGASLLG